MADRSSIAKAPVIPAWVAGFAALACLLLATGASLALFSPQRLTPPGVEINAAVRIYAAYTFSRNLSLLVVLLMALLKRSRSTLRTAMGMFSLVNLFDAVMDVIEGRYAIVAIALVLSLLGALAFARLSGSQDHLRD